MAGQAVALAALTAMTVGAVLIVDLFIAPDFPIDRLVDSGEDTPFCSASPWLASPPCWR
jgi:hypothetical protein